MPKKYTVIDTEFHHVPWNAAKKAKGLLGRDLKFESILERPDIAYRKVFNLETAIEHMDESGVDMALLGLATWVVAGLETCRAINGELAGLEKEYPGRFVPLAHVPCHEGQPAIDEMVRAVNDLGMKGVTIATSQQNVRLDDKQLKPFFKKVSQLRIPVVVHPTVKIPIWGGEKYSMSGSVSREYDIIKAVVEVLCGVLPEFPDLDFLFSHFGGGVPFLLGRIMSWYNPPKDAGIPKEMIGKPKTIREFEDYGLKKDFDAQLDRIYFNMAGTGGWMPAVEQALLVMKPDRLVFGSDYPWEMGRPSDLKAYIDGIKGLDIPEDDKVKILGGNVKKLFKI